jgi:hypothetical protein
MPGKTFAQDHWPLLLHFLSQLVCGGSNRSIPIVIFAVSIVGDNGQA